MLIRKIAAAALGLSLALGGVACDQQKTDDAAKAESEEPEKTEKDEKKDEKAEKSDVVAPFMAKGPVATVNGEEISADAFNEDAKRLAKIAQQIPAAALNNYKDQVVQRLIDKHLVEKKVSEMGIKASDEEVKEEYEKFKKNFPSEKHLEQFFERSGASRAEFKDEIRRSLALKKLLKEKHGVEVTDKKAKEFYKKNLKHYKKDEEVKASHVLLKVERGADDAKVDEVKKKAQKVAKEAKADGADFAAIAKKYSEGPTAQKGGDLGYFPKERMVPKFSETAFSLKPGEISDPVRTEYGFHVIKVVDKKEPRTVPFEEAKDKIKEQLERRELRDGMRKLMEELKKDAKIEKKMDNIENNPEFKPKKAKGMPIPGQGGGKGVTTPKKLKMPKLGGDKGGGGGK